MVRVNQALQSQQEQIGVKMRLPITLIKLLKLKDLYRLEIALIMYKYKLKQLSSHFVNSFFH